MRAADSMVDQTADAATLRFVAVCFEQFELFYAQHNYGLAYRAFEQALWVDAGIAFRYFITRASYQVVLTLQHTRRDVELANWLDPLIARYPYMHVLDDGNDEAIRRIIKLRESNLDKGLPSVVLITQSKSASVSVANIFNSGFDLPSFAYSLVSLHVMSSWLSDYLRGGACYTTHLEPKPGNIARFKSSGAKIIVHVRDPRQRLLSAMHHIRKYPEQVALPRNGNAQMPSMDEQLNAAMSGYIDQIKWVEGWVAAEAELNVLFSTFEDFVQDKKSFVDRYLGFYGGSTTHFSYAKAVAQNEATDYHFRSGLIAEWREVFKPRQAKQLSEWIPDELKQRFNWPD